MPHSARLRGGGATSGEGQALVSKVIQLWEMLQERQCREALMGSGIVSGGSGTESEEEDYMGSGIVSGGSGTESEEEDYMEDSGSVAAARAHQERYVREVLEPRRAVRRAERLAKREAWISRMLEAVAWGD